MTWLRTGAAGAAVVCMSSVAAAATVEVHVGDYYFTPQFADVQIGDTVRWIRDEGNHDVTSGAYCGDDSDLFYSPLTESNPVFEWTVPNGYDGDVISYTCSVGNHCVAADQFGALLVNVEAHYLSTNGFAFEPSDITVNAGDAVFWIHGGGSHTVTSGIGCVPDGRFHQSLDNFHPLPFYVVPSDEPSGVIDYYCTPHCGSGMLGTISVTGAAPTGACCFMNFMCDEDMTEEECGEKWDPDYTWYEGMNCDEADCLAIGACCLPDGSGGFVCQEIVQEDCKANPDGQWMGWVSCDEVNCNVAPTGACCFMNFMCDEDMTEEECGEKWDPDYTWYEGMNCDEADCLAIGACCLPDGSGGFVCQEIVQEDCKANPDGQWMGWVSCDEVTCDQGCIGDLDGDGTIGVDDLLQLLGVYGVACGDCPEDLDGSGVVDIDDLLQLLSVYGTDC